MWRVERRDLFLALRSGRRGRSGPLTVAWLPGGYSDPPRVAFAVGRRVGPAVARNRLRRQLRARLREVVALPTGTYLLGVGPEARQLSYPDLVARLDEALAVATRPSARTGVRP